MGQRACAVLHHIGQHFTHQRRVLFRLSDGDTGRMQRRVVLRLFHQLHRGRDHRAIEGKQPQHMVVRNIQPQLLHLRQLYRQQHHHLRADELQQRSSRRGGQLYHQHRFIFRRKQLGRRHDGGRVRADAVQKQRKAGRGADHLYQPAEHTVYPHRNLYAGRNNGDHRHRRDHQRGVDDSHKSHRQGGHERYKLRHYRDNVLPQHQKGQQHRVSDAVSAGRRGAHRGERMGQRVTGQQRHTGRERVGEGIFQSEDHLRPGQGDGQLRRHHQQVFRAVRRRADGGRGQ